MSERRWERITALAMPASAALFVGTLATWANPHYNDPLTTITGYYVTNQGKALASIDLWMFGMVSFLVLAAGLRSILRRAEHAEHAESDTDILSNVAFGGVVAMLCIGTAFNAMNGALALYAGRASESEVRLLMALSNAADNFQFLPLGVFLGAVSLAMLRGGGDGRVFARWVGWLGVVGGLLLVLGSMDVTNVGEGIGDLGMLGLLLFLIWTIAVSIRLLRRPAVAIRVEETPARASGVPA